MVSQNPNLHSHEDASIVVLKFGSSILADERSLPIAVHEVYRHIRAGKKVVAVVSAMGCTTNKLLEQAARFGPSPDPVGVAALAAIGEAQSVGLLTLALDRAGVPANALDHAALGLRTHGPILDAKLDGIDVGRVRAALADRPVLVVPGFLGRDDLGRTTLLGRGGSDFSALFIAAKLHCRCVLLKDVDGLYEADPSENPQARRFDSISYDDLLALPEGVVQHKAVRFAKEHGLVFGVGLVGQPVGSLVGPQATRLAAAKQEKAKLRVAFLGLGTVGLGVFQHVARLPEQFEVAAIGVKNVQKHIEAGIPQSLLSSDLDAVVDSVSDVIIETIGGLHPAKELILRALRAGKHVVTANKAVLAAFGDELFAAAKASNVSLVYSASVGGGVPVVESVRRSRDAAGVARIRGVLNGTTNFILGQLEKGREFDAAVKQAQQAGFAEADPSADLDGIDVANKLVVLAREAFGAVISVDSVAREGIRGVSARDVALARNEGKAIRLVGRLWRDAQRVHASVAPERVDLSDLLAQTRDEFNAVEIEQTNGEVVKLLGRGAGRWPTAESVFGDLFELAQHVSGSSRRVHAVNTTGGVA
ncbi:MAG TPA: homoserine dehydrogenase [Phycisphaerales bacterium]